MPSSSYLGTYAELQPLFLLFQLGFIVQFLFLLVYTLFILKYIEVEFDCYHYSKYIQFQQILKYCVITGSRLYININLKQHQSQKNESSRDDDAGGGSKNGDFWMTSFVNDPL